MQLNVVLALIFNLFQFVKVEIGKIKCTDFALEDRLRSFVNT